MTVRARVPTALLVATAPALGCVLVVAPKTYGDHCAIANASTDCGTCATARCQTELDACCVEPGGDATVVLLETCAKNHDASCDTLATAASAPTAGVANLARCVASRCAAVCAHTTPGTSQTRCQEPFLAKGSACTCTLSSSPNDYVCAPKTVPGSVCCAPEGWPGPGLECGCLAVGCFPSQDGCVCMRVDYEVPEKQCAGAHCCAQDDGCYCSSRACNPGQLEVASCDASRIGCPSGSHPQAACSVR